MFTEGQEVWCAIYGAGVVKRIRQESGVDYPVVVVFNRNDENVVTYTNDGKYHNEGNATLFPYPIEITKAVTKPSINWEHVSSEFNYLAEDSEVDGGVFLYENKPFIVSETWTIDNGKFAEAHMFASYIKGTCDWEDSLIERPN